jgi:hypothetical protein
MIPVTIQSAVAWNRTARRMHADDAAADRIGVAAAREPADCTQDLVRIAGQVRTWMSACTTPTPGAPTKPWE